ncbi:hypothetical protein V1520DRAFT_19608 [Lipomyces starkeyi]|uniref:Uncharacterized protein n=1 Tax=Lipomyces starkeyi NRRL Y-11557 TaxID=675824 RepID=A0A1E3PYJ2_LIPST|nr:hypothetical protein LIPSTDRAFT_166856 [Lipomyces starkeyi NRRL Y-11557]
MPAYPLLYIFPIVGTYAVVTDKNNGLITKIAVVAILLLFFPSVDLYLHSRRKRGIPDDFKYNSSASEGEDGELDASDDTDDDVIRNGDEAVSKQGWHGVVSSVDSL